METNLRHLKQTMKMDVLRCKSEDGVLKELMVDAMRWLLDAEAGDDLPRLKVNPDRPGRVGRSPEAKTEAVSAYENTTL